MKLLIFAALLATSFADLLSLRQKAPASAYSAGGSDFLNGPSKNSYQYNPPQNNYLPPQNTYLPPQNTYLPPQNSYLPPQKPTPPKPQYIPPATTPKPVTQYLPPQMPHATYGPPSKPQNSYLPPQNNYLPPSGPTTPPVPILKQTNELHEDGSFKYETLTGDQTHIEQMGHIENPGTDHEEQVMHGSYSYVGPDGVTYKVTYVADANGFRAFGDHLPTPPPIPLEIQQSLEQNAAEEAAHGQGYPSGPSQSYPSGPSQGYPSGPSQGYPSGPSQGYPSGGQQQSYLPPSKPTFNPQTGYHY